MIFNREVLQWKWCADVLFLSFLLKLVGQNSYAIKTLLKDSNQTCDLEK